MRELENWRGSEEVIQAKDKNKVGGVSLQEAV